MRHSLIILAAAAAVLFLEVMMSSPVSASVADGMKWQERTLAFPYAEETICEPTLELVRQDHGKLTFGKSILNLPIKLGDRIFSRGLGTHSVSHIRITSPEPIARFCAVIGLDNNPDTAAADMGAVDFEVSADGIAIYKSDVMGVKDAPAELDLDAKGAKTLDLKVFDGGNGYGWDHADWADAAIITASGEKHYLDQIKVDSAAQPASLYPFSFVYGGKKSDEILPLWKLSEKTEKIDSDRTRMLRSWTDPESGLKLTWEAIRYSDFPALDWVIYFENTGKKDTQIIENVQSMDVTFTMQVSESVGAKLHSNRGGTPDPQQFQSYIDIVHEKKPKTLKAGAGRSSSANFPFFKIESDDISVVGAVGWSGCWDAHFTSPAANALHATSGLELTHFKLHPGERVRMPRTLLLYWKGDTLESNAQFRQLVYKHYAAKRSGKTPLPTAFCNTCFTRGGGWLNECNEQNQISLIKAYAKLGLEALLTDAGWFEGGWPNGAGNWDPRKDAYPSGMAPVAKAAKDNNMIYGLWYEPERVMRGTDVQRNHPQWCLSSRPEAEEHTFLLDFGRPEVQKYFFDIVKGFFELPGFRVYRQDFNMDPLSYWRYNDAPDRQGVTEMKYIEGLYNYWDMIRTSWPDAFMEECASGGHRIDLETVMRLHAAQKTDYWFNDDVDQAALWGTSEYLPNNTIVAHLNNLDEYSFHSTMASSLCLGWIADDPNFDFARGKQLLDTYHRVKRLLVGGWYPLLPYSLNDDRWMASQYDRRDLGEGMILVFRRASSPYTTATLKLHALDANSQYQLTFDSTGEKIIRKGSELMNGWDIEMPKPRSSQLITYKKLD